MLTRKNALNIWLKKIFPHDECKLIKLAGDASHRNYYRLYINSETKIIMDSPPDKVPVNSFIEISHRLKKEGFCIPNIHELDLKQGFLLLDDFGDELFIHSVSTKNSDILYKEALSVLSKLQTCSNYGIGLTSFDKQFMLRELALFNDWFIEKYLGLTLMDNEKQIMADTFNWLTDTISEQPQVFVHLDYHSRNIMLVPSDDTQSIKLGIIDYQDAKLGPFTYDLVSLLKDCYIQWPHKNITEWLTHFYNQISIPHTYSLDDFIKAFDLCGLQRHLKVLGVFSRLSIRDNKHDYLQHFPLIFNYIMGCIECYNELDPFLEFMRKQIQPSFLSKIQ